MSRMAEWLWKRRLTAAMIIALALLSAPVLAGYSIMLRMPGKSHTGPMPPLQERESQLAEALRRDVVTLAEEIGVRCIDEYENLTAAEAFIENSLSEMGYAVRRQEFEAEGVTCANLDVEIPGTGEGGEIIVVGAHYDSVPYSPAANDNASGIAGMLALARLFAGKSGEQTLRFAAFANEEMPYFQTPRMGSLVYAQACKKRGDRISAAIILETIGYYTDEKESQAYPFPIGLLYPSVGNFAAFVGDIRSRGLVREAVGIFRKNASFPSEGGAFPQSVPGVGWSDHWAFWRQGYPALMVTDTAPFRYPHYHSPNDTPDKIDYERMARVVAGLECVAAELAGIE